MEQATRRALNEQINKAKEALNELPSVCQAVGTTAVAAGRCQEGSELHKERWDRYTQLNNQAATLSSAIRMALHLCQQAIATQVTLPGDESEVHVPAQIRDQPLCLNDWICEIEAILAQDFETVSALIPRSRRPHHTWWSAGYTPREAVTLSMYGTPPEQELEHAEGA